MGNPKMAVITGGSSGIGLAISGRLASENYNVINADIQPPVANLGNSIRHLACDITKAGDVAGLSRMVQREGKPDVLILNAGRGIHEKIRDGDPEKWVEIVNINICGTLRILRAVLPFMDSGNIIFISSVSAGNPHPYGGIYSCTKSAINVIADTLRLEEQPDIKVTVISPGIVNTPFFDNMLSGSHSIETIGQGALDPKAVADTVMFILSRHSKTTLNNISIRPSDQKF